MLLPVEVDQVFSPDECKSIVRLANSRPFGAAALVGGNRYDNLRRARIGWLDEAHEAAWIFRRLLNIVAETNRGHFNFEIEEFAERMQVAWYGADAGGFFDWHIDIGDGPVARRRKLTVVVQLSSGDSYEGGDLETNADGVLRRASRALGSSLLLPSFILHRVVPVTRHERYSLTLWAHGPQFK